MDLVRYQVAKTDVRPTVVVQPDRLLYGLPRLGFASESAVQFVFLLENANDSFRLGVIESYQLLMVLLIGSKFE